MPVYDQANIDDGWYPTHRQSWQIRLRLALLRDGHHKTNAWARSFTAWLEKPYWPGRPRQPKYPHLDGDFLVIGPECFTRAADHSVICWRGENYVPQEAIARAANIEPGLQQGDEEP